MNNHIFEETNQQTSKKAAIVVLISLKREAEDKSSEELKTEICKALEEGLVRIPRLVLEDVIVARE